MVKVKCAICGKEFRTVTNTHLASHSITCAEYKERYPDFPLFCEETLELLSEGSKGKNVGRERPDAKLRMETENPMKDLETAKKMGNTRSIKISEGVIKALDNLGHLPTEKELAVEAVFKARKWNLRYVGDGQFWIGNHCPDFIDDIRKIVVELDLNFTHRPEDHIERSNHYLSHGYLMLRLTGIEEEYITHFIGGFYDKKPHWEPILELTEEKTTGRNMVYNYHITPNNNFFANRILVHNCFADSFRASLYSSFFDNTKNMGFRNCSESFIETELEKLMVNIGKDPHSLKNPVSKAIALDIPMRLGIRFEDFTKAELKKKTSLFFMKALSRYNYPLMINTKSNIWNNEEYCDIMVQNNSAIHITIITADDELGKLIEPGAPLPSQRFEAAKKLVDAGVKVVARIEPYMALINDKPEDIELYIQWMDWAGIKHITADAYSYSANSVGVKNQFEGMTNLDFERMFLLTSDSQPLGSLALSRFLDCFREKGYSVSTFDGGNILDNSQMICCEVEDHFKDAGANYGSMVSAVRFIMERGLVGKETSWRTFNNYVMERGGFLSENLKMEVMELWNNDGGTAFQLHWIPKLKIIGQDRFGNIWNYDKNGEDYREVLWESLRR